MKTALLTPDDDNENNEANETEETKQTELPVLQSKNTNLTASQHSFFHRKMQQIVEEKQAREANRASGGLNLIESAFPKVVTDTENTGFKFPLVEIENAKPKDVFGLKGVLLHFGHGLRLYDGVAKKMVCKSIGALEQDELGNEVLIRSDLPMFAPISRLEVYGNDRVPHPDLVKARTRGMRGKSCVECVMAGEHILETNVGTSRCGQVGQLVFFVTEVLVEKTQKIMAGGKRAFVTDYCWEKLTEWADEQGESFFTQPTTVAIKMGAKSSSFKTYTINRKDGTTMSSELHTTSYAGSLMSVLPKPHTPADVLPWPAFLESVIAPNWAMCQFLECHEGGMDYSTNLFGAVVEVYATRPIMMQNGENKTPLKLTTVHTFRVADEDKEYREQAIALAKEQYVQGLRDAHERREQPQEEADEFYANNELEGDKAKPALPAEDFASRAQASMQSRLKR